MIVLPSCTAAMPAAGGGGGGPTGPSVASIDIDSTGLVLTIGYDQNANGHTGFTLNSDGGAVTATYSGGDGTSTQVFDLSRVVKASENVTLDYTPGDIVSDAAVPMIAFSGAGVFNGSTQDVPVADFTSDVQSGAAPLDVTFTDTSTNTPTSWVWEKNDGSGWNTFDGSPGSQNPVETFAAGTWSVRLTAINTYGSDVATITDLITAS